ncbi:NAD(P)/FAD-dependent oxidoreductase [Natronosporangium hydrolyticum]|uniref:NAD(P)/FAD-dependent oxidoreductase n=1 Tax=Natronosporangium hydrolyticum TaxID=2811111 RepID=A0A895YD28_9ACTN|nr:NAD(P)/FAD-dependent oxidoreductase [Natronosporangium hydrolyticum]QSB15687.1 NAD(P)/FAD-dependent oxidoreductase [Natronosporangium hydrolyticum]
MADQTGVTDQVDVIVVGLGPAGEMVGGKLAQAGLSVLGIEANLVGGECPYWGCNPSKMMIRAGHVLTEAGRVDQLAGTATVAPSWRPVAARVREEATADWDDTAARNRFEEAGGAFLRGRAELTGPGRVSVAGVEYAATRAVVLAAGTRPAIPPVDGLAETPYWTNREAIEAREVPESLVVLGGGAVGLELAQVYARFGAAVTVVEAHDRLASAEEPEASALLQEALAEEGITVHTAAKVSRISYDGAHFRLECGDDLGVTGQRLLVATGRRPDLAGLQLARVGLDPEAKAVAVDRRMRAGDRLWAVGDITGVGMFTHVAVYQAEIAVRDILGEPGPAADYRAVPRVTFTDPEVGAVGMTEAQARAAGLRVLTGVSQVSQTARGWIHGPGNRGFVKLIADADEEVLVGATAAGPVGGEVLSGLAVAVAGRVPIDTLRHMIYAYPTFHRGVLDAVRDLS